MMDAMMGFGGASIVAPSNGRTATQRTSGGVSVVDQSNASTRLLSPSGISRGLSLNPSDDPDDIWVGRLTLSTMAVLLIGITGLYIWTRNVQGGG